ncbi:MAG TPA: S53 family peptidase [Candidatus Elarobacter sp.]|jgi:kumamolisin|nr:S53 family peptidase [Candidatus Elarobacter sp.]
MSDRPAAAGFRGAGPANPNEIVRIVIKLRPREEPYTEAMRLGMVLPLERPLPDYGAVTARFGADQRAADTVVAFAQRYGLTVDGANAAARMVILEGTVALVNVAFGIDLQIFVGEDGQRYRGFDGMLHVPPELAELVTVIAGIDNRIFVPAPSPARALLPLTPPSAQPSAPFTVPELARKYRFPPNLRGAGQRVAVLIFGDAIAQADLDQYFGGLGIERPPVRTIAIGGFSLGRGNDLEPITDLEIVGAVAPGAETVAYFSRFTEAGWLETVTTAIHDRTIPPTVVSTCYGDAEREQGGFLFREPSLNELNRTFAEAGLLGITVTVASGDLGGTNDTAPGAPLRVMFTAAMPFVLACGGTMFDAADGGREIVWKDAGGKRSGGGASELFQKPAWQASANVPLRPNCDFRGRGTPDVAALAALHGYALFANGKPIVSGGTSAATPLWAGLIALINEALGAIRPGQTVGFINPLLYSGLGSSSAFNDITAGDSVEFTAGKGWDPCTGWGSPNGAELLRALSDVSGSCARALSPPLRARRAASTAS